MRSNRRRDLLKILHEGRASSQEEIVDFLRELGHDVTQATVSRDLREVDAMKVRDGDQWVYRLSDDLPHGRGDLVARRLERTLDEFVIDALPAASLVVLTTAPGHAAAVARAIDQAGVDGVIGTVAGDDTIFVATPGARAASALASRWSVADELPQVAR